MPSKKKNGAEGILGGILVVLFFIYVIAKNIISVEVIQTHGFDQYLENILSVDSRIENLVVLNDSFTIYSEKNVNKALDLTTAPGFIAQYYGVDESEEITWIAITYFENTIRHDRFILVPEKIELATFDKFMPSTEKIPSIGFLDYSEIERIKANVKKELLIYLGNETDIKSETNNIEKQRITDNTNFHVLSDINDSSNFYYVSAGYKEKYQDAYEAYLGSNFIVNIAQVANYDPIVDGIPEDESIALKIFLSFLVLYIIFKSFNKKDKNKICAWCGGNNLVFVTGKSKDVQWKRSNKDGSQDKRIKDNYQTGVYISAYQCQKCHAKTGFTHIRSQNPSASNVVKARTLIEDGNGERNSSDW